MKNFTISTAFALLAALTHAAPAEREARQYFEAQITYFGAPTEDASFTQSVPTYAGSTFQINNPLSVSKIRSEGGATCTFFGAEGSVTTVVGANTVDVGPPQPQVSGACLAL